MNKNTRKKGFHLVCGYIGEEGVVVFYWSNFGAVSRDSHEEECGERCVEKRVYSN